MEKGIIISSESEYIDYKNTKENNIKFIMIRAGYTSYGKDKVKYKDSKFDINYRLAKKNNIKIGAFYESCAVNEKEALEEAIFFNKLITNKKLSCPIAMMVKDDHSTIIYSNKNQKNLSKEKLSNIINTFFNKMNEYGYKVLLISYKNWFDNILNYEIEKYNNIILPDDYNLSHNLYSDNVIYMYNFIESIKINLREESLFSKVKRIINIPIKFIKYRVNKKK